MIAIYVRQSVDKKDSISIESQIDLCKKEINSEDYKVYNDKGYSGKNTERPNFKLMMADIKQGTIKKVICYKLDRISRNLLDFANIIDIFEKHNVDFISCKEKFDTSTPMGKAMLNVTMVFAQLERETIQQRVKDNYYARASKGMYGGGRTPYGLTKVETVAEGKKTSTFKENPDQAKHLIEMYNMYAYSDMSLGKISNYLNENKVPSAEGGLWDSGKISRILRSPIYVKSDADVYSYYKNKGCAITNDIGDFIGTNGCYLYGKREANERKYTNVENHVLSIALHKGIIDSNTWLLCQYKLDENKQIKNSGKGKHTWLSGTIKCAKCGYAVCVVSGRAEVKYLSCKGKSNLKACEGFNKTVYVDEVEEVVKSLIINKANILKNTAVSFKKNSNSKVNKLKIEVMNIDTQIENLITNLSESNDIAIKYINSKITELDNKKNIILQEVKKSTINESRTAPTEEILDKVDNWDNLSLEDKKQVCNFFIERIYLSDEDIDFKWRI